MPAASYPRGVIDMRLVVNTPRSSLPASPRGADKSLVDALLAADAAHRQAVRHADDLRAAEGATQAVKKATPEDRPAVLERANDLVHG
jgi:seryl-tRNA synthetase